MKSITSEIIDETINSSYENIRRDFFNDFWEKYIYCEKLIEESHGHTDDVNKQFLASDFAAFKTARDHCIKILREVLKKLLCEE